MAKFPGPILLPRRVFTEREKRDRLVVRSAQIGISIRLLIVLIEITGAFITHSAALFTDAVASLMDILSTAFLLFCIKLAQRPPDADHPFGHGRYEPLGGMLLGLFLTVMGIVLFVQQVSGVTHETFSEVHPWAWIFSLVAVILLEICYRIVMHTAKRQHSPALAADAVHYRIDSLTSLIATIALLAAFYFPHWGDFLDHLGAIFIAFFIIGMGFYAARDNFYQLTDKAPEEPFFDKVKVAALKVKGVKGTEKIRIQSYGPDAHVDIDIEVEPKLSVESAHKISQQVRAEIQKEWPAVRDVTVHVEPYYANDH